MTTSHDPELLAGDGRPWWLLLSVTGLTGLTVPAAVAARERVGA
jgi:hypothetical protein